MERVDESTVAVGDERASKRECEGARERERADIHV